MSLFFCKMSWRVLFIENSDYLNLYLDNLKISKGIDETTIPLSDINSIIIDNNNLVISSALISKCMEYNINVVLCDSFHLPSAIIFPYSGNYKASKQLKKQLDWEDDTKNILWKIIVKKKITNQKQILEKNKLSKNAIEILNNYRDNVEEADLTNREGLAAKIYFKELFGKDFIRGNDDPVNAALNYGYSILRSQICRVLVSRGLNPHFGIFHRSETNSFNLADDFIEPFRPIVDSFVFDNITKETVFNREIRISIIEHLTKKIIIDNKIHSITNSTVLMIDSILHFFETGDIDSIKLPNCIVYE